jgi:hypothetical protein
VIEGSFIFKVSFKKQIDRTWKICFLFCAFICSLHAYSQPNQKLSKGQVANQVYSTLDHLNSLAAAFNGVQCAQSDKLCWWFLFHLAIGDSGNKSMQRFADQVPISTQGIFTGEAHVFQYPAYWALKGVSPKTKLRNGQSLNNYIYQRNWLRAFAGNKDKEPSWYLIGQKFYRQLAPVTAVYYDEKACSGSHYLLGLSASGTNSALFYQQLFNYKNELKQVFYYPPEQALINPKQADLITHSLEALCLSGQREAIGGEQFVYTLHFLEHFYAIFSQQMVQAGDAQEFLKGNTDIVVLTADLLGHFRYGLKVCANLEPNYLNDL